MKKGGGIIYYALPESKDMWYDNPSENVVCSTGPRKTCLAFADMTEQIKKYFEGFITFHYASYSIKRIGEESQNGFIFEINNEKNGNTVKTVLKSAQNPESDNLMYEYIVGQYINKINKVYPCFLETYGIYKYKNETQWDILSKSAELNDYHILQRSLEYLPVVDYKLACSKSKHIAILIQHLPQPMSLYSLLTLPDFIENELTWTLFQLYVPLAKLMDNFTHYDLHLNNILLYEPVKNKYIHYHYHFTAGGQRETRSTQEKPMVVSFKSSYMLKIIDYGRCYFKDEESKVDAKDIWEEVCKVKECNPNPKSCGKTVGFSWLADDTPDPLKKHYISSQHKNISHDLLPLIRIRNKSLDILNDDLIDLIRKVTYIGDEYGAQEIETMGYPHSVNNVRDAASIITDYVERPSYQAMNERVNAAKEKLGDLHIYMYGGNKVPMKFIPA